MPLPISLFQRVLTSSMIYRACGALLLLLSAGCTAVSPPKPTLQNPRTLAGMTDSTLIACRFEKSGPDGAPTNTTAWYFLRDRDRTESRDAATQQSEIWERDDQGRLFKSRVFSREKVVLEYSYGDLLAANRLPTWESVRMLVNPAELGQALKLKGQSNEGGLVIESYVGKLGDEATAIDWLPVLKLPARIRRTSAHGVVSLSLDECKPLSQSDRQLTSLEMLKDYRHIDFTDLGDMESDPAVQKIMMLSGEHGHTGAGHGAH